MLTLRLERDGGRVGGRLPSSGTMVKAVWALMPGAKSVWSDV
jgi:hypothetical protein